MVGGGAAGLSAALLLTRVRRSVLVIDAGEPRNAPAARVGAHSVLGREGISPLELLRVGREEVASYGGEVVNGRVERVERGGSTFGLTLLPPAVPGVQVAVDPFANARPCLLMSMMPSRSRRCDRMGTPWMR
ncbi:hypothetical protein SSPO_004550 [Streptomyces antimycoticus]|uniref:FAD-binding domain-containing protein n=1 Tax=Streptomyces antimycoticus TaxID=68175 RepID=A0A499UV26_9ACTN|nr:hypothetical protein SSPO_004550 [Streptomyces antimycoticus]